MPKLTLKHIYFCRHGLSVLNQEGKWAGSIETPLTPEGRKQAREAGRAAEKLQIDHIICSPLARAHDTAKIIAKAIGYPLDKLDVNSLVTERHFGVLEGQLYQPDFDLNGISGAEALDTLLNRARLTLKHLDTINAETVLVVSHGGFGRALRHVLHPDIPYHGASSGRFENAQIVKLL